LFPENFYEYIFRNGDISVGAKPSFSFFLSRKKCSFTSHIMTRFLQNKYEVIYPLYTILSSNKERKISVWQDFNGSVTHEETTPKHHFLALPTLWPNGNQTPATGHSPAGTETCQRSEEKLTTLAVTSLRYGLTVSRATIRPPICARTGNSNCCLLRFSLSFTQISRPLA